MWLFAQATSASQALIDIPQGTAAVIATLIAAVAGGVGWMASSIKERHKAQAELEQVREQAALDLQNKLTLERERAQAELEQIREQARLDLENLVNVEIRKHCSSISGRLDTIASALPEMQKAIKTLCRRSREGKAITRASDPARFLEVTYGLHLPIAHFKLLTKKYDDVREEALKATPNLWNLWHIADAMEKTFIADITLAACDGYTYQPSASRAKDAANGKVGQTLCQDLNPEAFLSVLIRSTSVSPSYVQRASELRLLLPTGKLEPGFTEARRVIEPFSIDATPVFWRIVLAELLLIELFTKIHKGTFTTVAAIELDVTIFDPGPNCSDKHLDAARSYVEEIVASRLRGVA